MREHVPNPHPQRFSHLAAGWSEPRGRSRGTDDTGVSGGTRWNTAMTPAGTQGPCGSGPGVRPEDPGRV